MKIKIHGLPWVVFVVDVCCFLSLFLSLFSCCLCFCFLAVVFTVLLPLFLLLLLLLLSFLLLLLLLLFLFLLLMFLLFCCCPFLHHRLTIGLRRKSEYACGGSGEGGGARSVGKRCKNYHQD